MGGFTALIPKLGSEKSWPALGEDAAYKFYEGNVKNWCEAAYEEARLEASECEDLQMVNKYIDYLMGNQWPSGRPTYKSKPINNRVSRLFWELVSYLTDLRGIPEIYTNNRAFDAQAKVLNKCTLSWWMSSDSDMRLAMIVVYALLTTGYAKLEWNEKLQGGLGDMEIIPIGPNEILPLKARYSLGSAQAIIYQTIQPLSYFRAKYPLRAYLVQPDDMYSTYETPFVPPPQISAAQFKTLSAGMQMKLGRGKNIRQSAFPMALCREFWIDDPTRNESNRVVRMGEVGSGWEYMVLPGEKLYPRKRLIVMGGHEIVHDGPNPYWHGSAPFAALRMNIVPWQFAGVSELRSWIPLQDIINNILAGILDMIKRSVNPGFLAPKNAFSENFWSQIDWSMPGAKGAYNAMMGHTPQWVPSPALPGYVMQALNLVGHEMDQASGLAAVSEAMRKKQIPSGDTLESIRDSVQAPTRLKGRNIEVFLRDMGRMNLYNIFQFYKADRRIIIMGSDGLVAEDFEPPKDLMVPQNTKAEDHVKQFGFLIKPGSMLAANQMDRDNKLKWMYGNGALSRQTLLEKSDLNLNVPQEMGRILQEAKAAAEVGAAGRPGGGRR